MSTGPSPEQAINRIVFYLVGLLMFVCVALAVAVAFLASRLPSLTPQSLPAVAAPKGSAVPGGGNTIVVDETSPDGAIADVLQAQVAAWNKGDLDGFMAAYSKKELTFHAGDEERSGWQATYDRYKAKYGGKPETMGQLTFAGGNLTVRAVGNDTALVRGRWKVTGGNSPGQGLFFLEMRKENGGWKIVHDTTTAKPPPAPDAGKSS
jgi:ketosteroid isomerase-like protein